MKASYKRRLAMARKQIIDDRKLWLLIDPCKPWWSEASRVIREMQVEIDDMRVMAMDYEDIQKTAEEIRESRHILGITAGGLLQTLDKEITRLGEAPAAWCKSIGISGDTVDHLGSVAGHLKKDVAALRQERDKLYMEIERLKGIIREMVQGEAQSKIKALGAE